MFLFFSVNELKVSLEEYARQNTCLFGGTNIGGSSTTTKYVELQINQYQQEEVLEAIDHQHTRRKIINKNTIAVSDILPEKLFQIFREHILNTSDYKKAHTKEAKDQCLDEKGNIVGVLGEAGVGKTTLIKELLRRVVSHERLNKAEFIFHVKLRTFFDKTKINLFQFLMGNTACDSFNWMMDSKISIEVLKLLSQNESVCILLDGFDEANIDLNHFEKQLSDNSFEIFGVKIPEYFVLGILSGKILPKAKQFITSRPGQMLDLSDKYKPKFMVKLNGINQEGIEQFCHDICGEESSTRIVLYQKPTRLNVLLLRSHQLRTNSSLQ